MLLKKLFAEALWLTKKSNSTFLLLTLPSRNMRIKIAPCLSCNNSIILSIGFLSTNCSLSSIKPAKRMKGVKHISPYCYSNACCSKNGSRYNPILNSKAKSMTAFLLNPVLIYHWINRHLITRPFCRMPLLTACTRKIKSKSFMRIRAMPKRQIVNSS